MEKDNKIHQLKISILKQSLHEIEKTPQIYIKKNLLKKIDQNKLKKILKLNIKKINKNEFILLSVFLEMNIIKNSERLIKLIPHQHLKKPFKKYIFWNLSLFLTKQENPLKRYIDRDFLNINYSKIVQDKKSIEFQVYSNIIYKNTILFLRIEEINIKPILFIKNEKMNFQEKLYLDSIKERFTIESKFILKSYHLLFDQQKGFFFDEKEIKHQALKNKLIYNLKLSI